VLTNVVPYVTPVFVLEHSGALLAKNLFCPNKLRQGGLFLVNGKLVPLGQAP
jgi:hypothetical protein